MTRVLLYVLVAGCFAPAIARSQDVPVVPRNVVVKVVTADQTGSGFIVGITGERVSIVTARHVVDEKGPAGDETGWAACPGAVEVAFYPDDKTTYAAQKALCNLDPNLDLAVIEATAPKEALSNLRPYPVGTPAAASDNFSVTVIGHPGGQPWEISTRNSVTRYDPAIDARDFTFTKEDVRPGYSGGPVIADGLVGMATSTSGSLGIGLQWSRIESELRAINVPTTLLQGTAAAVVSFDPPLAATLADDAARNALRRYAYALNGRRRADILNVYPSVNRADLDVLLGDTSAIQLTLLDCNRTDAGKTNALANAATYSCAYSLGLTTRTGRSRSASPPDPKRRMTFELNRGPTSWLIETIK